MDIDIQPNLQETIYEEINDSSSCVGKKAEPRIVHRQRSIHTAKVDMSFHEFYFNKIYFGFK